MSTQNISEINFDNLIDPTTIKNNIKVLQEQLPAILDDFQKYYIFYNKNPESDEYKNMFENIKSNLQQISSRLFSISNSVDVNTDNINQYLNKLNILISRERRENRKLKVKLGIIKTEYNGSDEMINNYGEMYNIEYLKNWAIFIGIIFSSIILGTQFNMKDNTKIVKDMIENKMKIK